VDTEFKSQLRPHPLFAPTTSTGAR
jgi:hypothetical protein